MSDYSFIKEFQKIKLSSICKKLGINQSNILSGQTTDENYKKVKNEIIKELQNLFISDKLNSEKIITLYLYNELLEQLEKENKSLREMI